MKKTEPLVSVVMPVYNGEKYLAEAIESILQQTFTDFEFIIVDDGSTDGSAAIIEAYAKQDSRIRFKPHEKNRGESSARNTGIRASMGAYVAAMDCDDVSLPRRLEKQVALLNEQPRIGAVGVAGHIVTEDLEIIQPYPVRTNSAVISFHMLVRGANFLKAAVMTRREHLEAVGGFRPELKIRIRS